MLVINNNYTIAFTELLYFLKGFSEEEINKIPKELLCFFEENADKNYKCDFDYNADIENLHLKNETYGLISMICYNYWCETPEEKKQYLDLLNKNEKEYQKHISEKYNPDELFNKQESKYIGNNEEQNLEITKYSNERWYKRILSFLKNLKNNKK